MGVTVLKETTAEGLIRSAGRVVGVATDRGPVYAKCVFLAEGDASHLVTKEGLETVAAPAKPHFLQGIKEVLALDPGEIERRFHLKPGEGAAFEIIIRNGMVGGKKARLNMGGFLYTNRDSLSVGLVMPLDLLAEHFSGDHTKLMAWFKTRSGLAPWLAGTRSIAYGTKLIRGGGLKEMPRIAEAGLAVGGAASGLGTDFPYPNYTGAATATGRIFAEAFRRITAESGGDFTRENLEKHYGDPVRRTRYYRDSEFLRDWPDYVENTKTFFDNQVDFGMATARAWMRPDRRFGTARRDQTLALGFAFPPDKRDKWGPDVGALDNVFGMSRLVRHAVTRRMTFRARRQPPRGEVRFVYRPADAGHSFERVISGTKLGDALGSAARAMYANDERPLGERLEQAIDAVVAGVPMRTILGVLWNGSASAVRLPIMGLWNRLRGRKPADVAPDFVDWVKAGLMASDLSAPAAGLDERWEAKLGRLTYFDEPVSHIKLLWPASISKPAETADSPLWHLCPAHVYEKRTDLTGRPTLVVNYENCIKCESCWRGSNAVDWSRDRRQRLIYQVPVQTAADLAADLDRLDAPSKPALPYAVDAWEGGRPAGADPATLGRPLAKLEAKLREFADTVAGTGRFLDTGERKWIAELLDQAAPAVAELRAALSAADPAVRRLADDLTDMLTRLHRHLGDNKFFWAAADARQILGHHVVGLRRLTGCVADGPGVRGPGAGAEPTPDARHPAPMPALDRRRVLELDHGAAPNGVERGAMSHLMRTDDDAEAAAGVRALAGHDPGLAAVVMGHRAVAAALRSAGIDASERRFAPAFAEPVRIAGEGDALRVRGAIPLASGGWAEAFLVRSGDGGLFLIDRTAEGVRAERVDKPLGLRSAEPVSLSLADVRPAAVIAGTAAEEARAAFDRTLAGLMTALSLGAGEHLIRRAKEHATGRVQFPGLFTDEGGREAIIKFGAVKAMLSQMEARRWALDTLLARHFPPSPAWWGRGVGGAGAGSPPALEPPHPAVGHPLPQGGEGSQDGPVAALWTRLAAAEFFGPRPGGFSYNAGQIFGGTAFSEEDTLAKFYRDSATLRFLPEPERDAVAAVADRLFGVAAPSPEPADDPHWLARVRGIPSLADEAVRWTEARAVLETDLQTRPADEVARAGATLFAWACTLARTSARVAAGVPSEHEVELCRILGEHARQTVQALAAGPAPGDARSLTAPFVPAGPLDYSVVADWEGKYDSGDWLIKPDFARPRHTPEMLQHDPRLGKCLADLEAYFQAHYDVPEYGRQIERLHRVPADDIDRLQRQGYFRMIVPADCGGTGSLKAEYYAMIAASIRRGDMAQALTIQVNSSIGTTPILLGLEDDLPRAAKETAAFLADEAGRAKLAADMRELRRSLGNPGKDLSDKTKALAGAIIGLLSKNAAVRSVAAEFQAAFEKALNAGKAFDLAAAAKGMDEAIPAWEALPDKVKALQAELPRRRAAMELFLRLIAAGQVSGFALTEPSAGSDTARVATRAKLVSREVYSDSYGVRFFFRDDAATERRVLLDAARVEFDFSAHPRRILYRLRDGEPPVEIRHDAYDYETDKGRRYLAMPDGRRVEFDDIGSIRTRGGKEWYDYWEMSGGKMWITNGRMAGVFCLYARTPAGPTGFLVDRHSEGLVVGKDEEKLGQLGSPTNELSLDRVRVPADFLIGLEGRGQVNALQTLNVGRIGLALSSAAMLARLYEETEAAARQRAQGSVGEAIVSRADERADCRSHQAAPDPYAAARLEEIDRTRYVVESMAYEAVGLLEQVGGNKLIIESSVAKFFAAEAVHDVLAIAQEIHGAAGQTRRYEVEKHFRDARVLNIYEGTNEVQRFAILKELVDKVAAGAKDLKPVAAPEDWPTDLRRAWERIDAARLRFWADLNAGIERLGKQVWMNPGLQSTFFPLAETTGVLKAAEAAILRAAWMAKAGGAQPAVERAVRHASVFAAQAAARMDRLHDAFADRFDRVLAEIYPADIRVANRMVAHDTGTKEQTAHGGVPAPAFADHVGRRIEVLVPVRVEPLPAPEPLIVGGRPATAYVRIRPEDRAALVRARRLRESAPGRVEVTAIAVGPGRVREQLRQALAIGADRAVWVPDEHYPDQPGLWARTIAEAWSVVGHGRRGSRGGRWGEPQGEPRPDVVLCGAGELGWPGTALLSAVFGGRTLDAAGAFRLEVTEDAAHFAGEVFGRPVEVEDAAPLVIGVAGEADERCFTAADFLAALERPVEVVDLPPVAGDVEVRFASAVAAGGAGTDETPTELTPQTAVRVLAEEAGLRLDSPTGAAAAAVAISDGLPEGWDDAVLFVVGTRDDQPNADVAAGFAAAARLAEWAGRPVAAAVLTAADEAGQRKWAETLAAAGAERIAVVTSPSLAGLPTPAVVQALDEVRPASGPPLMAASSAVAEATAVWAMRRRPVAAAVAVGGNGNGHDSNPNHGNGPGSAPPLVPAGIQSVEIADGVLSASAPVGPMRRTQRFASVPSGGLVLGLGEGLSMPRLPAATAPRAGRVRADIGYDRRQDPVAAALAAALQSAGADRLEDAEFILDVGYGIATVDNYEELIVPLKKLLEERGVRRVTIGGTRRVTEELKILPPDRQIGQSGVGVNPTVMLAIGVSGAPQHLNYIGERAVILAFNRDPEAPLLTHNRRRPRPKVFPVVGDLFVTVPALMDALRSMGG
jgi:alkylation response protein AidB-like acyl-CoA dehydrogenase/ferredoxin-like protein FixX